MKSCQNLLQKSRRVWQWWNSSSTRSNIITTTPFRNTLIFWICQFWPCSYHSLFILRKPSILVVNWVSSCLSFFMCACVPSLLLHIFSLFLSCPTTIITLEPCTLDAEFQHFILKFNKILLLYIAERGDERRVKGGPKTGWSQGDFTDNSNIELWFSKNWKIK
jgi:hypothetical protein